MDVPERLERLTSHEISRLLTIVSTGLRGSSKSRRSDVACGGAARVLRRSSSPSASNEVPDSRETLSERPVDGVNSHPPHPPAIDPLRSLSSRYGAALDALRAFREVSAAQQSSLPSEYQSTSMAMSNRNRVRPHTARPQLSVQYYRNPESHSPERHATSPSTSPTRSPENHHRSLGASIGGVVGHRIDSVGSQHMEPISTAVKKGPLRPSSAPVKTTKKAGSNSISAASHEGAVTLVQYGAPSGRRPLSAKKPLSALSDRDRVVVGKVLQQEARLWGVDDEAQVKGVSVDAADADQHVGAAEGTRLEDDDASMGIVGDDGELEDAALENLQFVFRPHHEARGTSARHRPVSGRQQQQQASLEQKWHVLGTADAARVRAEAAPNLYFNAFDCSGISDFLKTQKSETFGTYRERVSAYMARKGIHGGSASSAALGGNLRHQQTPMGSEKAFLDFVEKEALRREKERHANANSARHVQGVGRCHLPTNQEAALRSPHHSTSPAEGGSRASSARMAQDQVRQAYRRMPLKGTAKPAGTQRW